MQGLAVVLFPVLLILFALAMEKVEFRLGQLREATPVRTTPKAAAQLTRLPARGDGTDEAALRGRRAS
ncbi:hypothetical protein FOS14_06015 [Skermania sp. ID1734]|uniref:hypothetical protein n=1 Tax=Skermania sp. ID1734 TaxID=2597516 RepID=UPI00117E69E5|nr:hypothetical protein [Skermania sp. ID1734]TSE00594.1 hypothetical protein FOS14_06015 [Skermania sp. ID1734]